MRPAAFAYLAAGLAMAVAIALRVALDPWLGDRITFALLVAAVAVGVWTAGTRAAVVSALAGYATVEWLLPLSRGAFPPGHAADAIQAALFALSCAIVIVLGRSMQRARRLAEDARFLVESELTHRAHVEAALALSEERLAGELAAMSRLHAVSTRLLSADNLSPALEDVLDNAIATCDADFGTIRLLSASGKSLEIAVQRGFEAPFLEHFREVRVDDRSSCARAMRGGVRIVVEDVERDEDFAPHRAAVLQAGFRAVQSTPLKSRDGTVVGMLSTHFRAPHAVQVREGRILDLYARHAADLVVRVRQEAALREADQRKDEFLATLAHELRNPLAPISNALHVLKSRGPADPAATWCHDVIGRQLRQMVRLLDDLLDMSRVSRGKIELRRALVPLRTVIANSVETSRPLIDAAGHRLAVDLPDENLCVNVDAVRMAQVFSNLLNNAARYTPEGGRIDVGVKRDDGEVTIAVEDSGLGIPADRLEDIFGIFTQVHPGHERSRAGLGIGLALVKALVEMHGGSVAAASEGPGRGSRFSVRLPARVLRDPVDEGLACDIARPAAARMRVLVVDDVADSAESLMLALRIDGHEAEAAFDGEGAVEKARRMHPDLVLLDLGMPPPDGYEVCARLRAEPWAANLFVVALTGWGQHRDRQRTARAGFDDHLLKPVERADLERLLTACAARRRPARVDPLQPID